MPCSHNMDRRTPTPPDPLSAVLRAAYQCENDSRGREHTVSPSAEPFGGSQYDWIKTARHRCNRTQRAARLQPVATPTHLHRTTTARASPRCNPLQLFRARFPRPKASGFAHHSRCNSPRFYRVGCASERDWLAVLDPEPVGRLRSRAVFRRDHTADRRNLALPCRLDRPASANRQTHAQIGYKLQISPAVTASCIPAICIQLAHPNRDLTANRSIHSRKMATNPLILHHSPCGRCCVRCAP